MRRRQHHLFRTKTAWERDAPATLNFSTKTPQAGMPMPHFLSTLFRANPQPRAWSEPTPVEHSILSISFPLPCLPSVPWLTSLSPIRTHPSHPWLKKQLRLSAFLHPNSRLSFLLSTFSLPPKKLGISPRKDRLTP